ncbi:DgyrCDS3492 [Dimorphilus gyrociliatus]|uniref:DgyrCDS3492 n=1 Tax=Dimorphilus gyrociliatus TaxID=2664684 RepID=A0A7I8VDX7_9ANNE|nr:DgyrCDS3492 [Dimorphilus gyrociliatus]
MSSRYASLSGNNSTSPGLDQNKRRSDSIRSSVVFDNSGFDSICEDSSRSNENDTVLQGWIRFREDVRTKMEAAKYEIDERRRIVESSIIDYSNMLHKRVDEFGNDCIKKADNIIRTLEYSSDGKDKIVPSIPPAPNTVPIKFETPGDFHGRLKNAFGDLTNSVPKIRKRLIAESEEVASMDAYVSTKDSKQCAISDVASSRDAIATTDRNNKTVKIFSKGGRLLSILNQKIIRLPEYVTAITIEEQSYFFVTDTGNCKIRIFDTENFMHVGDFATQIEKPGSCCFSKWNERVLVLDLSFKTINCFSFTGQREYSVPSHLNDPAYINCSLNGIVVISDWKNNKLHMYNRKLSIVKTFDNKGIHPGQLDRPFGVIFDKYDNLLVADKNNKRIQAFDEEGELRKIIIKFKKLDQPRLVMAITLNSDDDLITADHQGKIMTFRYLTNSMEFCGSREESDEFESPLTARSPRFGNYEALKDADSASLL